MAIAKAENTNLCYFLKTPMVSQKEREMRKRGKQEKKDGKGVKV